MIYQFASQFPVPQITVNDNMSNEHKSKCEKINKEITMGTHRLLSGFLMCDVSDVQFIYLQHLRTTKKPNIASWNRSVIQLLLDFSQNIWKYRSDILHAEATLTQETTLRNQAVELLRSLRSTPYRIPHTNRSLLERTSHYLQTTHVQNVISWTNRINTALEEQTHLEKTTSNDIRTWAYSGKIDSRRNCLSMKSPDGWYDPTYYDSDDSELTANENRRFPDEEYDSWIPNPSSTKKNLLVC